MHTTMLNFVKINPYIAIFYNGCHRHVEFLKLSMLLDNGVCRANMHHRAKLRQNSLFHCRVIVIFRIFKMATTAILDLQNQEILLAIRVQGV